VYRGRRIDSPSGWATVTTRKPVIGRNEETTRLPPGYRLDLLVDPCVIVLRCADGAVVARLTKNVDPEQIRRVAEEDRREPLGVKDRVP
jgi:hypothetical protein